jgi:hypothetical protein
MGEPTPPCCILWPSCCGREWHLCCGRERHLHAAGHSHGAVSFLDQGWLLLLALRHKAAGCAEARASPTSAKQLAPHHSSHSLVGDEAQHAALLRLAQQAALLNLLRE